MDAISKIGSNVAKPNTNDHVINAVSVSNTYNVTLAKPPIKTDSSVDSINNNALNTPVNKVDTVDLTSSPDTKTSPQANTVLADSNRSEGTVSLDQAIRQVDTFFAKSNTRLAFSIDAETERSVVTVKDKESGDVIRQIPSEEMLDIAAQIQRIGSDKNQSAGLLFDGII